MTVSMGGKFIRKIGLARNEAWWGFENLTFNLHSHLQRRSQVKAMFHWAS
jgi:hypothetical protein